MLTTHHFLFTAVVVSPLEMDDHSGAALRGSLFDAVWGRFCTNKASPSCAACPLHSMCPVSALVAPLREENQYGQDIPRPYIILPPLESTRRYEAGETLIFGITLFGSIIQLLPYIVMSLPVLEENGIGRKLIENAGRRGRFRIQQIEAYHPITGERCSIYQQGKTLVQAPTLAVTAEAVKTKTAKLSTRRIELNFLTPTRITHHEKVVRHPPFRPLIQRLSERLTRLEAAYGEASEELSEEQPDLIKLAGDIICQRDETSWEEVQGYSRRQRNFTSTSGFLGKVTYAGELGPFRELLIWGELIHVGKNAVKGNGWYTIVET